MLVAIGVIPNSDKLGLEEIGVNVGKGLIQIDDQMATNVPGIYAIGDVTGKMALAHVASAQGIIAAEPDRRPRPRCLNTPICPAVPSVTRKSLRSA